MDPSKSPSKVILSPEQHHHRQVAWQIGVPLALILVIFLASATLVVLYTLGYVPETSLPDQQSPLAKSSTIFIISGTCLTSLFSLMILVGMAILTGKIIKGLPGIAHRLQNALAKTAIVAKQIGDKLAAPVVTVAGVKAALTQLIKSLGF